ncbi:hypothetical protein ACRE_036120 [Hapsidospora chrysogenum ATCC 11550]|uniref:Uncharacterized protein n=1 Tax=Hapsidospora chrysogenum (strain ATCC 11550 / CBS 779.69 / DSM 880 / IAM 14645 / JCM 23072 / IMI 49137) TaxID=857340 RepID=A0A086T8B3_HAPC1|nr:hypothetical protein ACRE_036120 [Hapsidospora chrysogenum ATCC 11550]
MARYEVIGDDRNEAPPPHIPQPAMTLDTAEGEDADDIARSQLDDYYSSIGLWGCLRWLVSIVLLSASARIIDLDSIPSLKPFAIVILVCVSP